jgi:hypothetical protein
MYMPRLSAKTRHQRVGLSCNLHLRKEVLDAILHVPKRGSVAWETVIAAFGMISPVGPSVLKRPQRAFFTSMLPTVMFQTQMSQNVRCLSGLLGALRVFRRKEVINGRLGLTLSQWN